MPPSPAQRLIGIRAKIERAKHHIDDLEQLIDSFRKTDPYRCVTEFDSDSGHKRYILRVKYEPPIDLALVAGEAVHQLRSSLDHVAWQLVEASGQSPGKRTYFPICNSAPATSEEVKSFNSKVKGMSTKAVAVIQAVQPYQTGDNGLSILEELDNFDKHRLLFVAAADVSNIAIRWEGSGMYTKVTLPGSLHASGKYRVLKDGTELGTHRAGFPPDMDQEFHVAFEIVFDQPGVVQGQPVLPLLHQLAGLSEGIVSRFHTANLF